MFCVNHRLDVLKHTSYVYCVARHAVIHLWAETAVSVDSMFALAPSSV
jgi:hypothetical protein